MAEHWKVDDVLHEKSGELVIGGGDGDVPAESFDSKGSMCSSTPSLMAEDDHDEAESSLVAVAAPATQSSPFTTQQAEDQLDALSPLLANLSVRTGLSKYYKEKSRSFANLSHAKYIVDLPKNTTTYSTRMKASRGHAAAGPSAKRSSISCHVPGPWSKIITKKKMPRRSSSCEEQGTGKHLHMRARKST